MSAVVENVSLKTLVNPTPRQLEYLNATDKHRFTLYGGARGGGKSYIERWRHVRFLCRLTAEGIRNVSTGIFSNTFSEARVRQFEPSKREFPLWLGTHNESKLEFRFREKWGSHVIRFCNLADLEKYKSDQFATIGIEELTLCPDPRATVDILSGSLRWPGVPWTPMGFTTNPDGPGHSQVKRLFVTRDFTHPDDMNRDPSDFHFIRALPTDNPHLPTEYVEKVLGKLPDYLKKAWVEGSWDLFEGQRFEFNPRVHVVKGLGIEDLGAATFYRSIDYGFDNPYACLWFAVYADDRGKKAVRLVHEDVRSGLHAPQQIERVKQITEDLGLRGKIQNSYLDTACWAEEDEGLSIADKFMQGGIPVLKVLKSRPTGWTAVEDMLHFEWNEGRTEVKVEPTLKLFENCPITASQLTDAMWDPKKPGDILHPEGFRDDAADSLRYFILTHFKAPNLQKQSTWQDDQKKRWRAMNRTGMRL